MALAEVAKSVDSQEVATATGVCLLSSFLGVVTVPLALSLALSASGSYRIIFVAASLVAAAVVVLTTTDDLDEAISQSAAVLILKRCPKEGNFKQSNQLEGYPVLGGSASRPLSMK